MNKPLILESKLIPPDCSRMLRRDRLVDDFIQSDERLTIIRADAGYGKTTLMGQFHQELAGHGVWYTTDSVDRDIGVFLAYLIEGVSRNLPDIRSSMDQVFHDMNDAASGWQDVLTALISEIKTVTEHPLTFF